LNNDKVEEAGPDNTSKKSSIFRYSIFIGRIGDVPINIHFSFALIFSLIVWTLSYTFFPIYYPGLGQINYIILGLIGGFIALFSILLHELGHSAIAKKYGIKFERIVLFAFGGVALSDKEIADPRKEINMASAGPCISFIISSLSFSLWFILVRSHILSLEGSPLGGLLLYGGLINLGIGLFNLLPVFPSDGGRILRALLSKHNNHQDIVRGTKGAIRIGIVVSLVLVLVGVIIGLRYSFLSGLWLMILAFFLIKQSKWYYRQYQDVSSQI
jgi:Zn-dependent protease